MSKFAVGYSMKKKMAKGGHVKGVHEPIDKGHGRDGISWAGNDARMEHTFGKMSYGPGADPKDEHRKKLSELKAMPKPNLPMADGGDVDHEADMVHRILKKCYSEGGKVANESHGMADSDPAEFDDLVLDDHLEPHFPEDGNEHGGPEMDHEGEDMVKRILRKKGNPRPA